MLIEDAYASSFPLALHFCLFLYTARHRVDYPSPVFCAACADVAPNLITFRHSSLRVFENFVAARRQTAYMRDNLLRLVKPFFNKR